MSHIHVPDGVIPIQWSALCYVLIAAFLLLAFKRIQRQEIQKKVPFIGVLAALMLLTMSIPLGFMPFHLNMAVLVGIIAGPSLGFITVFVVNMLLGFLGHGGITVAGVNTLIIGSEVVMGSLIFRQLNKRVGPVPSAGVSTFLSLVISTVLMVGIVAATTGQLTAILPHSHQTYGADIEQHGEEFAADVADEHHDQVHNAHTHDHTYKEEFEENLQKTRFLFFSGWGAFSAVLIIGISLEALVTGLVVSFFLKVRPDMIELQSIA